jgi:hypothetical protein
MIKYFKNLKNEAKSKANYLDTPYILGLLIYITSFIFINFTFINFYEYILKYKFLFYVLVICVCTFDLICLELIFYWSVFIILKKIYEFKKKNKR